MPKLPSRETAFGPDRAPSVQRPIARYTSAGLDAPAKAAAEQGEAMARIGGMGFELGRKMVQREGQIEEAHARSTILRSDVAIRAQLPTDKENYTRWETNYREAMAAAVTGALEGVASRSAREGIEADFGVMVERGAADMANQALDREGDVGRAHLQELITANTTAMAAATSPELRQMLMEGTDLAIEGARRANYISDLEATTTRQDFAVGYVTEWISAMRPEQRIEVLREGMVTNAAGVRTFEPTGTEIDLLPPGVRLQMITATENVLAQSQVANASSVLTTADIEARAAVEADPENYPNAEKAYTAALDAAIAAAVATITDPVEADVFANKAATTRARGVKWAQTYTRERRGDGARANAADRLDSNMTAALAATDPAQQASLLADSAEIIDNLFKAGHISAEKAEAMDTEFTTRFAIAWAESFEPAARVAALSQGMSGGDGDRRTFEATGTHADFIPAETRVAMLNQANAQLNSLINAGRGIANEALARIRGIYANGHQPTEAMVFDASALAAPHADIDAKLQGVLAVGETLAQWARLPTSQIQDRVSSESGKPMTEFLSDLLAGGEALIATQDRELVKDGLSWGIRNGVGQWQPLDPGNVDSVRARVALATLISETYEVDVDPLTNEEIDAFSRQWDAADAGTRVVMLSTWAGMKMPKGMADRFFDKVSSGQPSMGLMAEATRNGHGEIVRKTLMGMEHQVNFPEQTPPPVDVLEAIEDYVGNALIADIAAGSPGRKAVQEAVTAAWIFGRVQAGADPTDWDARVGTEGALGTVPFDELMLAFVGDIGERHGRNFIAPFGETAQAFLAQVDKLSDREWHWVGVNDGISRGPHRWGPDGLEPMTAQQIQSSGMLVSVGDGKYTIGFLVGDTLQYAVKAPGYAEPNDSVYILDLNAINTGYAESVAAYGEQFHELPVQAQIGIEADPDIPDDLRGIEFLKHAVVGPAGILDAKSQLNIVQGWREGKIKEATSNRSAESLLLEWLTDRGFDSQEAAQTVVRLRALRDVRK